MLLNIYTMLIIATMTLSIVFLLFICVAHLKGNYYSITNTRIRIIFIFIICILYIARSYVLILLRISILGDISAAIFFLILGVAEYLRIKKLK